MKNNDRYINIYSPKELETFNLYLRNNYLLYITNKTANTDYLFQVNETNLQFLPRNGIVLKGNNIPLIIPDFTIELIYRWNNEIYYFFRRKNAKPVYDNLSIVIQGPLFNSTLDLLCILFIYGKLVVSSWDKYNFEEVKDKVETEQIFNKQNIYYQIYTTLKGLENITTKYVMKVRTDEMYADFKYFIDRIFENPTKIITTNIFIRKVNRFPYHCSDHLIGGTTENIIKMFNGALVLIKTNTVKKTPYEKVIWLPEQILTFGYFINFYLFEDLIPTKCAYLMNKHFKSVELFEFKRFKVIYTKYSLRGVYRKIEVDNNNFHIHRKTIIDLNSFENLLTEC
jgi:hypothetical protein